MKRYLPKLPAILLILGAILRIAGTGAAAIWFDETDLLHTSSLPLMQLFSEPTDNSGDLLLELILRPLLALSHSVWMLRLPSMLAGLISLWLAWKLMQLLKFTPRQQITAAAIIAFLPGLLWIAQDARSYGLLACLFLAAIWFAMEGRWLGLLAMCGLTIYAHRTGAVCAVAALAIAIYLHPHKIRIFLLVATGIALAWIPAIVNILSDWIVQQPWQQYLSGTWLIISSIQAIWPEQIDFWNQLAALILLILTMMLLFSRKIDKGRLVPLAAWMLSLAGLIVYSLLAKNNAVVYRTLMPFLFPFALWLGWELGRKRDFGEFMNALWAIALIAGLVCWHASDRGGHLDRVAAQIRSEWRPGDALLYTTATVGFPFDYYLNDLPHSWDATIQSPFLAYQAIPRIDTVTGIPIRTWVIIPKDGLITPIEQIKMDDLINHQFPVYTVDYMQTAEINVYLVEAQK
jgi:hypothetical protein